MSARTTLCSLLLVAVGLLAPSSVCAAPQALSLSAESILLNPPQVDDSAPKATASTPLRFQGARLSDAMTASLRWAGDDDAVQVTPPDPGGDWTARYNRAMTTWRAGRTRSLAAVGIAAAGLAVELYGLLTPRTVEECYLYTCFEVTTTNKGPVAAGLFIGAASQLILSSAASLRASAGAELASLEAERLRFRTAAAPLPGATNRGPDAWQPVSALQPGQFVRVERVKGQGTATDGWFVHADPQEVTLYSDGGLVRVDRSVVRRLRAVPLGRERQGAWGWGVGVGGLLATAGAGILMRQQRGLWEDITGTQAAVLLTAAGAFTATGVVILQKGKPHTVYEIGNPSRSTDAGRSQEALLAASRTRAHREQGIVLMTPRGGVGVGYLTSW